MSLHRFTPLFLWLVICLTPLSAQDTAALAASRQQYEYLKEETKAFRTFIENERKEHREFMQGYYTANTAIYSLLGVIAVFFLSFFSWQSRKEIRTQIEESKRIAEEQYKNEVSKAQNHFVAIINEKFQSNPFLKDAEIRYQTLVNIVQESVDLQNGNFLFLADLKKSHRRSQAFFQSIWRSKSSCLTMDNRS